MILFSILTIYQKMETHETFKKCLVIGNEYEKQITDKLEIYFDSLLDKRNDDGRYDMILKNGVTIEVKFDMLSEKLGRFFIEYKSRGRRSNIYTSAADYFVYGNMRHFYILSKDSLITLINTKNFQSRTTKTSNTTGYIVDESYMLKTCECRVEF
jgi:hypothetical protein